MARKPALHVVDDLLSPALARTVEAIGAPESDLALIALTVVLANAIDRMSNDERSKMLGQTAPAYLRCLEALEQRAARRRVPAAREGANPVEQLRRQHAQRFGA
jgi:hypothetical protein